MHPGQRLRLKRETAERTGEPVPVRRHGRVVATLSLGPEQGTARVRPWIVTMADGTRIPGSFLRVANAERAAIARAIEAEEPRTT